MFYEQSSQETDNFEKNKQLSLEPFCLTLSKHGLVLTRGKTQTLQVNVGFLCNQECRHCHLSCGPGHTEIMQPQTIKDVIAFAQRSRFEAIDITGGAPELNPHIADMIEGLSPLAPRIMLRSNLSALNVAKRDDLMDLLESRRVAIVASFPSLNPAQADSQRGDGSFLSSIDALRKLNALGYGQEGSDLKLNLVSNPTGAFLPPSQVQTEKRFRQVLEEKWGIVFNNLFNFANVRLGRYRQWLKQSGNFETYMEKLVSNFNPCSVDGVMCRSLISVSWEGYLFDCDFNLARGLYLGGRKMHISQMAGPPEAGSPIAVADHCFTCTAGAGFT
ncbi:MAG: arsenosugar biosynthesis radical SAM protein ArsS [Deltaproteobacteria bacterium]|nr:MAG: arsenosugar biosynthesis radical SAM protein ArsS [Deltaproteobacteria bacterium]